MKVLIFDRKIETLHFLYEKFNLKENEVVLAENGSKFLPYILNKEKNNFDAIIISKKELMHYGVNEEYFFKRNSNSFFVCSYSHCDDYHIKEIKISNLNNEDNEKKQSKTQLRSILKDCKKKETFDQDFIYKLPKKTGILLKHLAMNEDSGLSDEEIAELFWGKNNNPKKNCIYNHIYNLRKYLKSEFKDSYIIHKEANRYKLIRLKKEA